MKKLLFILLGLAVVIVAAVFVVPGLVDWNAHKDRVTVEVEAATGRAMTIEGDISLSLLPTPALSASKISLANIEGGSADHLIKLEELRVRVALMPLLQGKIQVESFTLIEPEILLEELPDGRRNWEFQPSEAASTDASAGQAGDAAPSDGGGLAGQIRFDRVEIEGGSLVIATPDFNDRIDDLDAQISADTLHGPYSIAGTAKVRGLAPRFNIAVGRLVTDGASSLSFEAFLGDAVLQFSGALSNHPGGSSLRGNLRVEGQSLSALASEMAGDAAAPLDRFTQAFSLSTTVSADQKSVKAEKIALRLGDVSLSGELVAALADRPEISIDLAVKRLDLDDFFPPNQTDEPAPIEVGESEAVPTQSPTAPGAGREPAFALPSDVNVAVRASVEALVYRQQVVRQLRVEARLVDGELDLTRFIALLPGGSDVALTGKVTPGETGPRFDGSLEAASDNLRGLLAWIGVDVAAVPSDRLRKMSFSSQLAVTPEQLTATRLDLRLDVSRITGGVAIALRERLGLGIGLKLDKMNLDAYLPPAQAGESSDQQASQQAAFADGTAAADNTATENQPKPDALAHLAGFDANMDIKVGNLTYQGMPIHDVHLDGTLQNGALTVRQFRVGDVAGASGQFVGKVSGLEGTPSLDGRVDFDTRAAGRLAKLAGLDAGAVGPIEEISVRADLAGSMEALSFDGNVATLGGTFNLTGLAKPEDGSFDFQFDAGHPSLPGLLHAAGAPVALNPALGQLEFSARVSGTPLALRADDLRADFGGIKMAGAMQLDLSGDKPKLGLDLDTGDLRLDQILAQDSGGGGGQGGALHPRWSRESIDVTVLENLDADLNIRSTAILAGGVRLDQATLVAVLRDAVVDLQRLSGVFYDGAVLASGRIQGGAALAAELDLGVKGMNLQRLLREFADNDRFSGPLDVKARLSSRGRSEADLVSNLSGEGEFSGGLIVKMKVEEQAATALLGLLGKKVKEVRGLSDATAVLFQAFAGPPSDIAGTFAVAQGLLTTRDTKISGRDATAETTADISLPAWQMDSRTTVYRSVDPQTPYLTAAVRGPINGPNVKIGGQPFQRRTDEPATSQPAAASGPQPSGAQPTGSGTAQPSQQPQDLKKLKPKDVLKQLLKGLE